MTIKFNLIADKTIRRNHRPNTRNPEYVVHQLRIYTLPVNYYGDTPGSGTLRNSYGQFFIFTRDELQFRIADKYLHIICDYTKICPVNSKFISHVTNCIRNGCHRHDRILILHTDDFFIIPVARCSKYRKQNRQYIIIYLLHTCCFLYFYSRTNFTSVILK